MGIEDFQFVSLTILYSKPPTPSILCFGHKCLFSPENITSFFQISVLCKCHSLVLEYHNFLCLENLFMLQVPIHLSPLCYNYSLVQTSFHTQHPET